jgi:CheY-like chemotaxis protein
MARLGLVVDDDNPSRKIYGTMLANMGFELLEAMDGVQAVEILQQCAPDVILLDLLLPRMSGVEVLDFIYNTEHLVNTRVIIISAHGAYQHELVLKPGDLFLLKPISVREVREVVQQYLQANPS